MYAAAGGASLASRQARQKQRKQNKNERLQQLKNQKLVDNKLPTGRQFQNYTEPKIKLSRVERNALRPPVLQAEARRHSTSHLKEPSRARIRESPSVLIPIQNHLAQHHQHGHGPPVTPGTLVQDHAPDLHPSCSIQSQLPQVLIPEGEGKLERRCSFVRQVEEMEKCHEGDVLDRCNHICNFEIKDKQPWDSNLTYYSEFHRSAFGSLDYPFSEARTKIHDSSYGGESEEDIFAVYHQSAAANALLYVGLGTTAIGSVVFFVGSGDKGFKTLELRLIGPTLVACGLLCCLIRILLCACPSTCIRRRKKARLKNGCPHGSGKFSKQQQGRDLPDFVTVDPTTSLISKQKKRVSIAHSRPIPSTSTAPPHEAICPRSSSSKPPAAPNPEDGADGNLTTIPIITVPEFADFNSEKARLSKEGSGFELQNLELTYDLESVSSNDSDSIIIETETNKAVLSKLTRTRVPVHASVVTDAQNDKETSLSIVVERSDNSDFSGEKSDKNNGDKSIDSEKLSHSGILLSPLQLEQ